ncbi:MAG TPA: AraC family transcriptional regulator [Planctomycetota bacterium]|nr:AraC family transcriptional regulator [Planctomycetota bacterium]
MSATSYVSHAGFILKKARQAIVRGRVLPPDEYIFMFILAGKGIYHDPENGERTVAAGDVILTFPRLPHWYYPDPEWDEAYIMARGPLFTRLEAEGLISRDRPVISPGLSSERTASITSLVEESMRERSRGTPVLTARLHLLLAEMDTADREQPPSNALPSNFVRNAQLWLESDLDRDLDPRTVPARFGFGYERFRKLFAAETGTSPARYRILKRIDRAKALLAEGRLSVKEIAEQLGYCDVYFFARQFKQVTGKTPSEFRRV